MWWLVMCFHVSPTRPAMMSFLRHVGWAAAVAAAALSESPVARAHPVCDVRAFGAKGDGVTLDTDAIQQAINDTRCSTVVLTAAAPRGAPARAAFGGDDAAAAGLFLSGSLRLRSHLRFVVAPGVMLLGANASVYDWPEPNQFDAFQDFGHSHWHNALLWAEGAENLTVTGTGGGAVDGGGGLGSGGDMPNGYGDKMLALKSCTGVALLDLEMSRTGHFALLATNVTGLEMRGLRISPTRDGIDLVSCSDVYATGLSIAGGGDDAFVLKSDYSLGAVIHSRNITLENSSSSTNGATALEIGSETVGDFSGIFFRNIEVHSAGNGALGMAIMDGAHVSDVLYSNITISGAASPLQFYIGARQTGHPAGTGRVVGAIRDVRVEHVHAHNMSDPYHPGPPRNWTAMLDGMPATNTTPASSIGPNVTIEHVAWRFNGGGSFAGGNRNIEPPHPPLGWSRTGPWPSYGFFVRHVHGVTVRNLSLAFDADDGRPAVTVEDASGVALEDVLAQRGHEAKFDVLVRRGCRGLRIDGGNVTANTSATAAVER